METLESLPVHSFNGVIISKCHRVCTLQSPFVYLLFVALWFILRGDLLYVFPCVNLFFCFVVLVFCSPFSIAITSLGEERSYLCAFRMFVRFVLVWICRFPLPLGVWEGLRFAILALPGLFSCLFLARRGLTIDFHLLWHTVELP